MEEEDVCFRPPPLTRRHRILPDGNCLFRALSYPNEEEGHLPLRILISDYIRKEWHFFSQFVLEEEGRCRRDEYAADVSTPGRWGDELCIRAFVNLFRVEVRVSYDDPLLADVWYSPPPSPVTRSTREKKERSSTKWLLFCHGCHYDVLLPIPPPSSSRCLFRPLGESSSLFFTPPP